ncbi:MAG: hypothetical protein GXY37_00700 [Chloroflexi bacterium]|nr:hypothetical protein [Chloroflexota bacterium]
MLPALFEKYRTTGVDEISDLRIFRSPPFFLEMWQAHGVARRFGSLPNLQLNLAEL